MYGIICPFGKTFDEIGVIYYVPDFLKDIIKIGQIVEIPLNNNIVYGVILDLKVNIKIDFDESKIKSIITIHNKNIFLSTYRIDLVKWISIYYYSNIHNSLNLFLVKNLKEQIIKDKLIFDNYGDYNYIFNHNIKLKTEQEKAYLKISSTKNNKILFHGLTGSGKTEIYIKLIKDNLDKGKQSLFLIPEIILTNQISSKIKQVFGNDIIIINSTITEVSKRKYWLDINAGKSKIIIGTRSALFYPYSNLGLIIIDEEHDNSYLSDKSPRYSTIEVAEKITELNKNKLVLGSGTPSIKSMYKGLKGDFYIVSLLKKFIN